MTISSGQKFIAYVNSYNKIISTDSTSDFSIIINLPPHNNYDKVVVSQISIPKSYYLVPLGYNTFTLQELTVNYTVSIPVGNYTISSFITQLSVSLNTASSTNHWVYTTTFSSLIGKITISVSDNGLNQPSIITGTNIYEMLGFSKNTVNTFIGNTITSFNTVKLQLEDCLYILSDCSNALNGVLQEVYCNTSDFSNITFQQTIDELYSKDFIRNNNNIFRFTLTDENFRTINLNGLNLNMTLIFYKQNDEPELSKDHILLQNMEKLNVPNPINNIEYNNNNEELIG